MMAVGRVYVFPSILEAIIIECPGISGYCVVDIPHPELNFVPLAAVIRTKGSQVTEQQIIDFVAERQPPEKQLKGGVVFLDDLPRMVSCKFKRHIIRDIVWKQLE